MPIVGKLGACGTALVLFLASCAVPGQEGPAPAGGTPSEGKVLTKPPATRAEPPAALQERLDSGSVVRMKVEHLVAGGEGGSPAVLLRSASGGRYLPITISRSQALSMAVALDEATPPRPLTHDLLASAISRMGGEVGYAIVTRLVGQTFHAVLGIRDREGITELDSRPSDAIALALRVGAAIYASAEVLERAGVEPPAPGETPVVS